jgi:hypothetical protein
LFRLAAGLRETSFTSLGNPEGLDIISDAKLVTTGGGRGRKTEPHCMLFEESRMVVKRASICHCPTRSRIGAAPVVEVHTEKAG